MNATYKIDNKTVEPELFKIIATWRMSKNKYNKPMTTNKKHIYN